MFEQIAKGRFTVPVSGCFHCGPNHDSPKTFNYHVVLQYPSTVQDQKGFLLDNTTFHDWFRKIEILEVSCETLACQAACAFWDMAWENLGGCFLCRVAITGFEYSDSMAEVVFELRSHKERDRWKNAKPSV